MSPRVVFGLLFALGLAVIGALFFLTRPEPEIADVSQPAGSTDVQSVVPSGETGPVLVIEVAGQANGTIEVQLFETVAPGHVERVTSLAEAGEYDNVVFHRVIGGFMAQTGDVEFGNADRPIDMAGRGGSAMPDLKAEFSDVPFVRGVMGMARSQSPHSANSQFFLMFAPSPHLNNQYTVVGQVISGLEVLDAIKLGTGPNGAVVSEPDIMSKVTVRR